jgi:hypothetical protein
MRQPPPPPRAAVQRRSALLGGGLLALVLIAAGSSLGLGQVQGPAPTLQLQEPIETADQRLRQQGWQPDGDPGLETFDRELAGNALTSLRSCSGTGSGFCRYDYHRGRQQLSVITVPNANGDGLVHHWQLDGNPAAPP